MILLAEVARESFARHGLDAAKYPGVVEAMLAHPDLARVRSLCDSLDAHPEWAATIQAEGDERLRLHLALVLGVIEVARACEARGRVRPSDFLAAAHETLERLLSLHSLG